MNELKLIKVDAANIDSESNSIYFVNLLQEEYLKRDIAILKEKGILLSSTKRVK